MNKYWTVFKTGWEEAFEYRTEFFISLFSWGMRLVISLFIFQAVYQTRQSISGFTLRDTIVYLIIMQVLMNLIFSRMGHQVATEIQNGDFSNFLLKPISYLWYQVFTEFSKNLLRSLIGGAVFGVILFLYDPSFFRSLTIMHIVIASIAIIFAYLLNAFMVMSIAMLGFWIVSSGRLLFMFFGILTIFSGMSLPLDFFPTQMKNILYMTPFPYLFYFPSQIIMNKLENGAILNMFITQITFTLIMFVIVKIILFQGIKKYEAVGR